jgi:hypothetical protein
MALTYAQIINLAAQEAKVPGFTEQAGLHLNMVLEDLALNYNFDLMQVDDFTITTGTVTPAEGPYPLPSDFLRHAANEVRFVINGTPFNLYQKSMGAFKEYFTGPGIGSYPEFFAIDFSEPNGPKVFFWPPPNGSYTVEFPYQRKHTYEPDPASSSNIPWFPMSSYLVKETAARLCSGNDDDRAEKLSYEAKEMLKDYLTMKDDNEGYAMTVGLDRNNFPGRGRLRGTKQNPWST